MAANTHTQIRIQTVCATQMPPLPGLRMIARDMSFYNDATPAEVPGRARDGTWQHQWQPR